MNVAEQVCTRYGLGHPLDDLVAAARGEQGRIWRLDTEHGSYAVKELFDRVVESDAEADVQFQEAMLGQTHVSLPRPIRTLDSSIIAVIDSRQMRVYEWVDLLPIDYQFDPAVVGETIAAIHRVRHQPARPVHPWYTDPVGTSSWHDLGRRVTASRAPFADPFAERIPQLIQLEALLEPPRDLQNCHRDLFADNLLPGAQGGLCVIDWENCGLADPGQEVAVVMFDFTVGDPARSRAFHEAYVGAGGRGRLNGRGSFTMLIAQFGHFYQTAAEEWLDPHSSSDDKEHAISRFDELFAAPLDINRIDQFLDAIH